MSLARLLLRHIIRRIEDVGYAQAVTKSEAALHLHLDELGGKLANATFFYVSLSPVGLL